MLHASALGTLMDDAIQRHAVADIEGSDGDVSRSGMTPEKDITDDVIRQSENDEVSCSSLRLKRGLCGTR